MARRIKLDKYERGLMKLTEVKAFYTLARARAELSPQTLAFMALGKALALKVAADFAHDHRAGMDADDGGWNQHRKDEPDCSYCEMIEDAKVLLNAIEEEAGHGP